MVIRAKSIIALALSLMAILGADVACGETDRINTNEFCFCAQIEFKGYEGVELADFPAMVRVGPNSIPGFRYSDCALDGGDIDFADTDGNLLAYDLDEWNRETGEDSIFWVKLPKLAPQTKITVYWSAAVEFSIPINRGRNAAAVWSGCYGVWHLGEKSAAGHVTPCANSSSNGAVLDAIPQGANCNEDSTHVVGAVGRGRTATKNKGQTHDGRLSYLKIGRTALATSLGDTFAVSGWFFASRVADDFAFPSRLISCKNKYTNSDLGWELAPLLESAVGIDAFGKGTTSYGTTDCPEGFNLTNGWMHVMAAYSGSQVRIYLNGELASVELRSKMEKDPSGSFDPATNNAYDWCFGAMPIGWDKSQSGFGHVFVGDMDEIRVSYVNADYPEASSARVKADYDTVAAGDFATYSAAVKMRSKIRAKDFYKYAATITFKGYEGETLADFPALVRVGPRAIKGFKYAQCENDGTDIAFVDDKGRVLPSDLDEWCGASGEDSIFWVRIPELKPSTAISVYWGHKGADSVARRAESVWDGYAGVWHCSEVSGTCSNSTSAGSAMNAQPVGVNASTDCVATNGVIGSARQLLDCGYPYDQDTTKARHSNLSVPSYDGLRIGSRFVWSGWFRAAGDHLGQPARLVSRKHAVTDSNSGWEICLEGGASTAIRIYGKSKENSVLIQSTVAAPFDLVDWTNISVVFDENALIVYVNGEQAYATATDFAGASDSGFDLWVGGMNVSGSVPAYGFVGDVDEFRLEPLFNRPAPNSTRMRAVYETVADEDFATCSAARSLKGFMVFIL